MLTTKKFIKEAEKLGFRFLQCTKDIEIYYENHQVAYVCWYRRFYVGITYKFCDLPKELQEKLFNLLVEYARTPLDEREEQERFFLKFKIKTDDDCNFLNYDKNNEEPTLDNSLETSNFQTRFTQKEINDIRRKFGVTLSDFEQIPVDEYCEEDED